MADAGTLTLRLAANIDRLQSQLDKAKAKVQETATGVVTPFQRANKQISDGLAASASQMSKFGSLTRNQQFIIRDASYQLQDMAVQLSMGQSAFRVMGQQIPQLLGPMGMFGAILGTVVAVAAPLAGALLGGSEASKTLDQNVTDLSKAVDAYVSMAAQAVLPTDELAKKYGDATGAAHKFIEALRNIDQLSVQDKIKAIVSSLEGKVGGIGDATSSQIAGIGSLLPQGNVGKIAAARGALGEAAKQAEELNLRVEKLSGNFKVGYESAQKILEALADLKNASGIEAQTDAASRLADAIKAAYPKLIDMPKAVRDVYDQVAQAGNAMAKMQGTTDGTAAGLTTAAAAASRLADELKRAVGAADSLAQSSGLGATLSELKAKYKSDTVGYARAAAEATFDAQTQMKFGGPVPDGAAQTVAADRATYVENEVAKAKADKAYQDWLKSHRSGLSDAKSADKSKTSLLAGADNQLAKAQMELDLIGKTTAEQARLRAEYQLLAEAHKKNLDLDQVDAKTGQTLRQQIEAKAKAIGDLTTKADAYTKQAQFMNQEEQTFEQGVASAITAGKGLGSVLQQIAQDFEKAAIQAALFGDGPLSALFGKSGGGGGLLSGLLGAIGFRANGGDVSAGQAYVVGEKRPELFVPDVSGTIVPAIPKMGGGGSGGVAAVHLSIGIDDNGQLNAHVTKLSGATAAHVTTSIMRKQLPAGVKVASSDPRKKF